MLVAGAVHFFLVLGLPAAATAHLDDIDLDTVSLDNLEDLVTADPPEHTSTTPPEPTDSMSTPFANTVKRGVEKIVRAAEMREGQGANVKRTIGIAGNKLVDPMLMLDHFFVRKPAGFPSHPHRGQQTVTYMLEGAFRHKDNKGHEGVIVPGGVQWMTAGSGIIHSEMPETDGMNSGLQLWLNLEAKHKMMDPDYQELGPEQIPKTTTDEGLTVRVVAGESHGLEGPVKTVTPSAFVHFTSAAAGVELEQAIDPSWAAVFYVIRGKISIDSESAETGHMVVLSRNSGAIIPVSVLEADTDFVYIAGKPSGETIVQYGPFVMNSMEEIQQAFSDYQSGNFAH